MTVQLVGWYWIVCPWVYSLSCSATRSTSIFSGTRLNLDLSLTLTNIFRDTSYTELKQRGRFHPETRSLAEPLTSSPQCQRTRAASLLRRPTSVQRPVTQRRLNRTAMAAVVTSFSPSFRSPPTISFLCSTSVRAVDRARRQEREGAIICKQRRRVLLLNLSSVSHQWMDLRDKVFLGFSLSEALERAFH